MLQDVDMDDPGQTKRGARFEAKMDVGVSERRSSHQTGFDLTRPSDPLSSMATAPSTTVEGDSGNAFATPQRPIHPQVTDSPSPSISRQGSMGQTPSNLSRRISGKMSLGTLGFPSPHPIAGSGSVAYDPASSFTQHRSPASFPDTPSGNLSSSPSKHPTSPLSGSISPSSSFPKLPAQSPFANVPANSPWAHLAATSGEPTCSIDGPGGAIHSPFGPPVPALGGGGNQFMFPGSQNGQGRSISPHLGAPFELLNLGGGTPGPSRAPPGWPGVPSGTAQTPGIASHGMADPFSTLPTSTHSSSTTPSAVKFAGTNSNGSSGEMTPRLPTGVGSGFGIDSLAAKLAKRRGSKSGPSNLSKSTTATPTTETEEDRAIATAAASKKPFGPVSGPGRPAAGAGMPFKLNLPGGLAGRGAKGADGATSTSSTPGLSLSKPSGAQGAAGRPVTIPQALLPAQLPPLLKKDNGEVLILDLRPPSSFFESHLPNALSLPVPSTLLKRPAFTVEKLAEMLPANARKAVTSFTDTKEIVIIDQDSPIAAPGSVIVGLASKFGTQLAENVPDQKQSGWNGRIFFVKGGMSACSEVDGLSMEAGQDVGEEDDTSGNASSTQTDQKNGKMIGRLDRLAFSSGKYFR
jgi:rhodanese-related sulfurtransferase